MKKYLLKWIFASLLIPGVIVTFHQLITVPDYLILLFWPSSIVLMALDTNQPPDMWHITYVWSFSLFLNVVAYVVVGLFLRLLNGVIHRSNEANS